MTLLRLPAVIVTGKDRLAGKRVWQSILTVGPSCGFFKVPAHVRVKNAAMLDLDGGCTIGWL